MNIGQPLLSRRSHSWPFAVACAPYSHAEPMTLIITFGSGIGTIGGRTRRPMASLVATANEVLARRPGGGVRIVSWFGHSGNFVVDATPSASGSLRADLRAALGTPCRTLSVEQLQEYVAWLDEIGTPLPVEGAQWVPGLAFLIEGHASTDRRATADDALFERYAHDVVGLWKRATIGSRDSSGWGMFSRCLSRQLGGTWTVRSARSVLGVLRRAALHGAKTSRAPGPSDATDMS